MRDFSGTWHPADDPRDGMAVQFYTRPMVDKKASAEDPDDRIVWKTGVYARLQASADSKSAWDLEVERNPELKLRFSKAWSAFERGAHDEIIGTPLSEWNEIPRAVAMNLNQIGFLSVEDVASVQDDQLARLGQDSRKLRDRARVYLEPKDRANVQLQRTVQDQAMEIQNLQAQIAQLQHHLQAAMVGDDEQPKRRGRPPKSAVVEAEAEAA